MTREEAERQVMEMSASGTIPPDPVSDVKEVIDLLARQVRATSLCEAGGGNLGRLREGLEAHVTDASTAFEAGARGGSPVLRPRRALPALVWQCRDHRSRSSTPHWAPAQTVCRGIGGAHEMCQFAGQGRGGGEGRGPSFGSRSDTSGVDTCGVTGSVTVTGTVTR